MIEPAILYTLAGAGAFALLFFGWELFKICRRG